MADQATDKKYKAHTFNTSLEWTGDRNWIARVSTCDEISCSPPKVFRGEEGNWTPEDLMLASVTGCLLSTFVGYAERKHLEVVSYEAVADGILEHDGTNYRFTKITVKPKIGVKSEADIETAKQYAHRAHDLCFMAYSVKADVIIEPEVFVAE
ncbi:MAG TPA: OsmC family protein [bacterium]|jgi:organic hydroperoxide reductase OsmC/OhrA